MKVTAPYNLDGIKYFRPVGAILSFACRRCGEPITIDAGDGLIEYPESEQVIDWIECDCGEQIKLEVRISMFAEIEYKLVSE